LDAGWGYLRQHLADKAADAGRQVVLVNPSHTSRTCSSCGAVFPDISLADRWVQCPCGLSLDRDVNSALNILKRAGYARWGKRAPRSPAASAAGECHGSLMIGLQPPNAEYTGTWLATPPYMAHPTRLASISPRSSPGGGIFLPSRGW
jgi:hypothetical protein